MLCSPSVCRGVRLALALPQHVGAGAVRLQLEHQRAVVERGDEQPVAVQPRRRDGQAGLDAELLRPVTLPVSGSSDTDRLGMPDDELALAARLVDHRRSVADFRLPSRQRPPQFLAGVLVEGHDDASLAADQADELVAVEQRAGREAPPDPAAGALPESVIVLAQFLRPDHFAGLGIQAEEVAHRPQSIRPGRLRPQASRGDRRRS